MSFEFFAEDHIPGVLYLTFFASYDKSHFTAILYYLCNNMLTLHSVLDSGISAAVEFLE